MFCQHCKSVMKRAYRFENGKSYKLWKCLKCYIETKPCPYRFTDELEVNQNNTPTNKPTMLHDNGKLYTKTRTNAKGVKDGNCHYYQHYSYGSYECLFYLYFAKQFTEQEMTYISNLIYYHMHPYCQWKQSEKALNKDKSILGDRLFNDIILLHDADLYAH